MGWHKLAAGGIKTSESRHAGHKGAQGKKPRCKDCLRPRKKCTCQAKPWRTDWPAE